MSWKVCSSSQAFRFHMAAVIAATTVVFTVPMLARPAAAQKQVITGAERMARRAASLLIEARAQVDVHSGRTQGPEEA